MRLRFTAPMLLAVCAFAQQDPDLAQARVIFRGEVVAVQREVPPSPDQLAPLRITFRVDDGIRGVITGETITVQQWRTDNEYRLGETLVIFLHERSNIGLTSAVTGRFGHRRPDEISAEMLNEFRTSQPQAAPTPVSPAPSRPARKSRP